MRSIAARTETGVHAPASLILVGNPNVGKSVIFGLLTGRYVTVSNYPGTTVEVTRGTASGIAPDGRTIKVIDTPGINTLLPQSEDERVTRDIVLHRDEEEGASLVQVGDAKNLPRALLLTLQLAEMGVPFILCLNMHDEANSRGITIDFDALSARLGVPVFPTVAIRRQGLEHLRQGLLQAAPSSLGTDCVRYDPRIEEEVALLEPLLPETGISRRSLALMVLAGDATLTEWLGERVSADTLSVIESSCRRLREAFSRSVAFIINQERMKTATRMASDVTKGHKVNTADGAARRAMNTIGALSMHPLIGFGILTGVLYLMYLFVGVFGAGTAVDWLETGVFGKNLASLSVTVPSDGAITPLPGVEGHDQRLTLEDASRLEDGGIRLRLLAEARGEEGWEPETALAPRFYAVPRAGRLGPVTALGEGRFETTYRPDGPGPVRIEADLWSGWINPALYSFFMAFVPFALVRDIFVGQYGLMTMGATYAIAIVLPIVTTFFFAFSILEDSGYLPRLAIMLNRIFRVIGLNGKAVLPMVLGLGCDTMATLTTRILETRKERTIVILLLALGVPCSAQLGVILGMLAGLSLAAALVWTGVILGVIVLVGYLSSLLIPGDSSDFIMEIPPIRVPALANIATKTMARIEWYLKEAVPLFLLGTLILFVADRIHLLTALETGLSPLITGVLDLPARATEAFVIGFLRRDFGSAGLYRLSEQGLLDPIQVVVSLVTVTLFIPCIANFFMIVKERGLRVALLIAAIIFPFAVLVGGSLNFVLRTMGVTL